MPKRSANPVAYKRSGNRKRDGLWPNEVARRYIVVGKHRKRVAYYTKAGRGYTYDINKARRLTIQEAIITSGNWGGRPQFQP